MTTIVPTLSTFGWVSSRAEKIDFLIAHYFNSDKNQTDLYSNNVSSFVYTIQKYSDDMTGLQDAVRSEIITYLSRYYEAVDVEVTIQLIDPNTSTAKTQINLSINVTDNGVESQVSKVLQYVNGQVQTFINTNNYGVSA